MQTAVAGGRPLAHDPGAESTAKSAAAHDRAEHDRFFDSMFQMFHPAGTTDPPPSVPPLAMSSTTSCTGARHIIHCIC